MPKQARLLICCSHFPEHQRRARVHRAVRDLSRVLRGRHGQAHAHTHALRLHTRRNRILAALRPGMTMIQ